MHSRPSLRPNERRSVRALVRSLEELAHGTSHLFTAHLPLAGPRGEVLTLPRFLFTGPGSAGSSFQRIGIFAALHGDEVASAHAAVDFVERLAINPEIARGFEIFVYPVCNPGGYADATRWSRSDADLNREFWRDTSEPEVMLLERQLRNLSFDGLVALHTDDTSDGAYGYASGDVLARHLLEPALSAASVFVPVNRGNRIDGWNANGGIIESHGFTGVLTAPPGQQPRPFEIVFETPHFAPLDQQINATTAALTAVLENQRALLGHAPNL